MKKANSNKRKLLLFLVLFALCLSFFNLSCGLDVLKAVLNDPYYSENTPIADRDSESDFATSYFKFSIRKVDNSNDFGRASIYYKIYNDYVKASSEESSLISKASDTERNMSLTTMKQNGYRVLHYMDDDGKVNSLELSNGSHKLWIRLTNYDDSTEDYSAGIIVDEQEYGIPVRHNGKTFDFGRSGINDENPFLTYNENDSDSDTKGFVEKQAEGEENIFYVVLFGAYEDYDENFDENYSPIHHLGRVKIDANKEKN